MKFQKYKLSLLIGCAIQLANSSHLSANYDLEDFEKTSHVAHYNKLPSVEENDAILSKSPQFPIALEEAEEIITRYELNEFIGLRLIHRHYPLVDQQVMTEDYKQAEDVSFLITTPYSFEEANSVKAKPASWIFGKKQQEVFLFESSTDSAVKEAVLRLQGSPEFFEEMEMALKTSEMTDLLSVAVLKRDSLIATENQVYMEVNSADESKSIVQLWDASEAGSAIRTSWSFRGPKQQGCAQQWTCYRAGDPDTHQFIYSHPTF